MFEKVFVPVDSIENEYTLDAAEEAIAISSGQKGDVELTFMHVFHPEPRIPEPRRSEIYEAKKEEVNAEFEYLREMSEDEGLRNVKTLIEKGDREAEDRGNGRGGGSRPNSHGLGEAT